MVKKVSAARCRSDNVKVKPDGQRGLFPQPAPTVPINALFKTTA
jgi:hypothetical protein